MLAPMSSTDRVGTFTELSSEKPLGREPGVSRTCAIGGPLLDFTASPNLCPTSASARQHEKGTPDAPPRWRRSGV